MPAPDPTNPPSTLMLCLTTESGPAEAEALARQLLERRLVACVSLRAVRSLYHWRGEIEASAEVELLLKTSSAQIQALEEAVRALHSYATPEWLCWPAAASGGYAAWAWEATSARSDP